MEEMLADKRFAHITKDPKFRRIPKAERKIKIDKRFQGMFKDKKFSVKYTVDKRGRPTNQTSMENLRKYYELSSSDDDSENEEIGDKKVKITTPKKPLQKDKKKQKNEEIIQCVQAKQEQEDEDSSDNCFSSNGELLRIKPQEKSTSRDESEVKSESDPNDLNENEHLDLHENEKQLHMRKKGESAKLTDHVKEKLKDLSVNYARGEGVLLTESSSEEESSEYDVESEEIEHDWGELDKEADTTEEVTKRIAVCNMDWDRIRAVDLMVLFNSFLPNGGFVHSVTIYPSEFGMQRMKEEEAKGPVELVENDDNHEEEECEENEEGSRYHMEKLRKYQLNRLKYYYAVVEFDSPETANKIYTECDGIEYESTATKLDLRFIPDDMTFDQEPREVCTEVPELTKYQPRQFTTTALQQVKVQLTWDETNPDREEITQKLSSGKVNEVNENDLQAYLASATSEEDTDKENENNKTNKMEEKEDAKSSQDPIEKYKSLLQQLEEEEEAKRRKDVELEFTWGLGEKEKTEKLVKESLNKTKDLTPFEQYLEKRKAKRKAKKEELKKLKEQQQNDLLDSEDSASSDLEPTSKRSKKRISENGSTVSDDENEESRRAAELDLLLMDKAEHDNKSHFNMKKIEANSDLSKSKKKRLKKKQNLQEDSLVQDDFQVNVNDERFEALYSSHHFNIDPADPHYRKTKGTEALINEKLKRRAIESVQNKDKVEAADSKSNKKISTELQALIRSVKKNTQNISQPIK